MRLGAAVTAIVVLVVAGAPLAASRGRLSPVSPGGSLPGHSKEARRRRTDTLRRPIQRPHRAATRLRAHTAHRPAATRHPAVRRRLIHPLATCHPVIQP
jgi:hypothetical protein